MYRWVVFVHVLSALLFFLAHGASMAMSFQLRREREVSRIRAILESVQGGRACGVLRRCWCWSSRGIVAGIMGSWFSHGWIWTALVLLVLLWFGMAFYSMRAYAPIRKAVGLPYIARGGEQPAGEPASAAEIAAAIQAANPGLLMGVSVVFIGVILWLMMFKPF